MKVSIIGSTKVGYELPIDKAVDFGGKSAGICYMPNTFQTILEEDENITKKRIDRTKKGGHHSVYDHPTYNLLFEDIPKIIAMILNNEKCYATSEKSARYTKMVPTQREMDVYDKWIYIIKNLIHTRYPKISERQVEKLAQENARYMISVFTPTTMEHTLNLKQINYILRMMEKFINETPDTLFFSKLKLELKEFINRMSGFRVEGMNCDGKNRSLSLFDHEELREEQFGENYCTIYWGSLAMLAQAQRHRTLDYKMWFDEKYMIYYVPPIIMEESKELIMKWQEDIISLYNIFPQGLMVRITERGTYENFLLKCTERLCGSAQLEIMERTAITFNRYVGSEAKCFTNEVLNKGYSCNPRCKFPGWKCTSPCIWGPDKAFDRLI